MEPSAERLAVERGKRIKQRRKSLGLTLEIVSHDIGISRAALWKWEAGQVEVYDAVALLRLSRRLYTSMEYLLWGESQDPWMRNHGSFTPPRSVSKRRS